MGCHLETQSPLPALTECCSFTSLASISKEGCYNYKQGRHLSYSRLTESLKGGEGRFVRV